ncbi:hypothetical protein BLOT_000148 [Blomia tropicalis]|nr:hypothetical protein BLOT_000148 [Blomia tropicalis]
MSDDDDDPHGIKHKAWQPSPPPPLSLCDHCHHIAEIPNVDMNPVQLKSHNSGRIENTLKVSVKTSRMNEWPISQPFRLMLLWHRVPSFDHHHHHHHHHWNYDLSATINKQYVQYQRKYV